MSSRGSGETLASINVFLRVEEKVGEMFFFTYHFFLLLWLNPYIFIGGFTVSDLLDINSQH